jgi:hypothetical protein
LLEITLKILHRKTGAGLIFQIALTSLHIDPDAWICPVLKGGGGILSIKTAFLKKKFKCC